MSESEKNINSEYEDIVTNSQINFDFIDDTSSNTEVKSVKKAFKNYNDNAVSHIDVLVKIVAFIVAFLTIIISMLVAFFLISLKPSFSAIAVAIIIVGTVFAAMLFFPIYGMGQIISQNNEILKRFKK